MSIFFSYRFGNQDIEMFGDWSKVTQLGSELNSKVCFFNHYFIAFHVNKEKVTKTPKVPFPCVGNFS